MHAVRSVALGLLCAIDVALGVWLAYVFGIATRDAGAARTVTSENIGYLLLTAFLLVVPVLCWLLRQRVSVAARLVLAALPIVLFVALGGKLWVRWE